MRSSLSVLLAVAMLVTGCIPYAKKRTPQLAKPLAFPEVQGSPRVQLVVQDGGSRHEKTTRTLERLHKKFPWLPESDQEIADPDYRVELWVQSVNEPMDEAEAWLFLLWLPVWSSFQVTVSATVRDSTGRRLGTFESTGKSVRMWQWFLWPLVPVTAPAALAVKRKTWSHSFRDALIQAGAAIAEDQGSLASATAE